MAFTDYIQIEGEVLPLPTAFDIDLSDIEAKSTGVTEAGTTQRDVVRSGLVSLSLSFNLSPSWLQKFSTWRATSALQVSFIHPLTSTPITTTMYMDGFKVTLAHDTSSGGLWSVSFALHEY